MALCFRVSELAMNAFFEHHKHSIRFAYRCFDRLLLNAVIQPFQQAERVMGWFFWSYRHLYPVSRKVLHDIADQYHNWVRNQAQKWCLAIEPDPKLDATISSLLVFAKRRPMQWSPLSKRGNPPAS